MTYHLNSFFWVEADLKDKRMGRQIRTPSLVPRELTGNQSVHLRFHTFG